MSNQHATALLADMAAEIDELKNRFACNPVWLAKLGLAVELMHSVAAQVSDARGYGIYAIDGDEEDKAA